MDTIMKSILPYQEDDLIQMLKVLEGPSTGVINRNCRGSGKTMEAIATAKLLQSKLVLIFCPGRLRLNWKAEIEKWTGEDSATTYTEYYKRWREWFPRTGYGKNASKNLAQVRWFITNIEQLRQPKSLEIFNLMLEAAGDDGLVIIDEAHRLRNHTCLLYTSPSPRDRTRSRMPSSA